jgi:glyoxylase I family protein
MNNITGIGGFMFRAKNPAELKQWYMDVLGIDIKNFVWNQEAGPTVFEPQLSTAAYFPSNKVGMINFRVHNLRDLINE